jgi:hypothetical protein
MPHMLGDALVTPHAPVVRLVVGEHALDAP